eukprot:Nitzschia sp. Nitz4//scaffold55_size114948//17037//18677//NITZ4_003884-RA/size114948-processed-gene-0.199-mRNA-1//1//CDS//3329554479//8895//frame0
MSIEREVLVGNDAVSVRSSSEDPDNQEFVDVEVDQASDMESEHDEVSVTSHNTSNTEASPMEDVALEDETPQLDQQMQVRVVDVTEIAQAVAQHSSVSSSMLTANTASSDSLNEIVESLRMSHGDLNNISDQLLKRRVKDFQYAQMQRHKKYAFRPFGIVGLFVNVSDIRSDLRWAQDCAIRRAEGRPYISWQDYETSRQQEMNRPYFTYSVLTICTVLMIMAFYFNDWKIEPLKVNPLLGPSPDTLLLMGGLQTSVMVENGSWFRLMTAVFLHGGILHWLMNCAVLGIMSRTLERNHGSSQTAIIFLVSAVGGNICSCLMQPGYVLVGASGGIFGLIGVCVADVVLNWKLLFLAFQDQDGKPATCLVKSLSVFWLLVDLAGNSVIGLTPYVDNFAHLGGLVYGFLISLTLLRRLPLSFFEQSGDFWHSVKIGTFRRMGILLALGFFCLTVALLRRSDGTTSPCFSCRYISCAPFPFWTEDKWWECDGCDTASGNVFSSGQDGLLTDLELLCPETGDIVDIDISGDGFYDTVDLKSSLPAYCRAHC